MTFHKLRLITFPWTIPLQEELHFRKGLVEFFSFSEEKNCKGFFEYKVECATVNNNFPFLLENRSYILVYQQRSFK